MRFVRKNRVLFLAIGFLLLFTGRASAQEIPSLTWERGKSLNVVLGGSVDNLDWNVFLEDGGRTQIAFSRSRANDAGFYVYTISLPKEAPLGRYQIVARDDSQTPIVVAGVEVVDRFTYNINEIPRDLVFILISLIMVLGLQSNLRTWIRREIDEKEILDSFNNFGEESNYSRSNFLKSFIAQRIRWKENWLGKDFLPPDLRIQNPYFLALAPLFALVFSLYLGVAKSIFPLSSTFSLLAFAILSVIAIFDRYSAKLSVIGLSIGFMVFNEILNFPTILSFAVFLTSLFVPQYVGDLSREFCIRNSKNLSVLEGVANTAGAFAAGLSIFWIYLLSESLRLSDSTDATKVTPLAILIALAYQFRVQRAGRRNTSLIHSSTDSLILMPTVRLSTALAIVSIGVGITLAWTGDLGVAISSSIVLLGSLITLHFGTRKSVRYKFSIIKKWWTQLLLIFIPVLILFYFVFQAPLVIQDRTNLLLVLSGVPVLLVSILNMLTNTHNELSKLSLNSRDSEDRPSEDSYLSSGRRN